MWFYCNYMKNYCNYMNSMKLTKYLGTVLGLFPAGLFP